MWHWVKPRELIDTNWSDDNGGDRYPDSMLDFAFAADAETKWKTESRVIVRPGNFPDDEKTADHKPVEVTIVTAR